MTYTDARWPWHVTVIYKDGIVSTSDYGLDFDAPGYAQHVSAREDVERVELSTVFVSGQQVSPAAVQEASDR